MSRSTIDDDGPAPFSSVGGAERTEASDESLAARYHANPLTTPLEVVGFWSAIGLPFLSIPLLLSGVDTSGQREALVVLLALNALALLFGHTHRRR